MPPSLIFFISTCFEKRRIFKQEFKCEDEKVGNFGRYEKKNESSTGPMKVLLEKLYHFMGFIELQAQMGFLGISVATLQP